VTIEIPKYSMAARKSTKERPAFSLKLARARIIAPHDSPDLLRHRDHRPEPRRDRIIEIGCVGSEPAPEQQQALYINPERASHEDAVRSTA
jgi:hypothetical protein